MKLLRNISDGLEFGDSSADPSMSLFRMSAEFKHMRESGYAIMFNGAVSIVISRLRYNRNRVLLPWLESGVYDRVPYIFAHPVYDSALDGIYKLNLYKWRVHIIIHEAIKD